MDEDHDYLPDGAEQSSHGETVPQSSHNNSN